MQCKEYAKDPKLVWIYVQVQSCMHKTHKREIRFGEVSEHCTCTVVNLQVHLEQ